MVIALKTVSSELLDSGKKENNIDEMTSILFLPAVINEDGKLGRDNDKTPWIPREFLEPMIEPQISLGKVEVYDKFLEETTDKRNQICLWIDYVNYARKLYEKTVGINFFDNYIEKTKTKLDGKFYIFENEQVNSTTYITKLYNDLLNAEEPLLYSNVTNGKIEPSRSIVNKTDIEKLKGHMGQMGGEYPLSESQREVISCFQEIREGEVLAVNGPPGTGKTTFLQSIVANMYVKSALKKMQVPIIVATSTNNQAVTNIIDSFGKIKKIGINNLENRWITGVNSFAVYFPSRGKEKKARTKKYHYTSVKGGNFADDVETEKNRKNSAKLFEKEFGIYFNSEGKSLNACKETLYESLEKLNEKRNLCIDKLSEISRSIGQLSAKQYIDDFDKKLTELDENIKIMTSINEKIRKDNEFLLARCKEWRESYNNLPWYIRVFKFLPCFKRKIYRWSFENMKEEELGYLKRGMSINEIESEIYQIIGKNDIAISENKEKISQLSGERKKVQSKKNEIIEKLCEVKKIMITFSKYKVSIDVDNFVKKFNVENINDELDKIRYVEFWLTVHYYEALWLIEDNPISEKQRNVNFTKVVNDRYHRLSMLTPCMVMTTYMLPKQFCAYDGNEKKQLFLYNYIDLLIVDEAGQISPEIGIPAFALAKRAIVVGDEQQNPPVWGIGKALDITMAIENNVISSKKEYSQIEENGINCSKSSVMKIASQTCPFEKFGKGLFLKEHRRCYNEIIQYCNKLVYDGKLEPLRGSAQTSILNGFIPAMGHKQIEVSYSQKISGSRLNKIEAEKIVEWIGNNYHKILEIYKKESKNIEEKRLIGVISPFKRQSIFLKKLLKSYLPEIEQNIEVGTVHTFQGAERKIIIFSSTYGNKDGCYFIDANKSLMNVAVSRAEDSFLIFGDRGCLIGNSTSASGMLKRVTSEEVKLD